MRMLARGWVVLLLGAWASAQAQAPIGQVVPGQVAPAGLSAPAALQLMRERAERWEPSLNAVIAFDPQLQAQAERLQAEAAAGKLRGPLHGMPVLLKDNIEALGLPTTAGSLALADNDPGRDAELTRRLRAAGLLIAGKTNLSEWANFRDQNSTSGWSGVGGLTRNAIDPSRTACGSSSGSAVAVAAGYVPFAVGTETNGSIVCPASYNGIVGIKPTVGLVSRRGIVPISHSQDTAGPMAYSVRAAALLLSAMEGEDAADIATLAARSHFGRDYVSGLRADGLQGLRLGVIRSQNFGDGSEQAFAAALEDLAAAGAVLVEDLAFPEWPEAFWDQSYAVLVTEFKHGVNAYLASLSQYEPSWTLQRVVDFNQQQAARSMPWFGQSIFIDSLAAGSLEDEAYRRALLAVQTFTRETIDGLLAEHDLDALVAPTNALAFSIDLIHGDSWHGGTSSMSAIAGYPHITVPAGRIKGMPAGLSFMGAAFSEPVLIRAAYAYEQATDHAATVEGSRPWALAKQAGQAGL